MRHRRSQIEAENHGKIVVIDIETAAYEIAEDSLTAAKISEVCNPDYLVTPLQRKPTMSDLDRGIMKFKGADNPIVIAISAALVLGSIGALVIWALRTAYVIA